MATFIKQLEKLLAAAADRQIISSAASDQLLALAHEQDKQRGALGLAAVLGWLGGTVTALGVVLLVAANWDQIPDGVKIVGFLLLLGATHGLGLWIRYTGRPLANTADALNFTGAALFIAGVGLIAQIYHLNARPPNGVFMWLLAIAPLAVLLRSGPITALTLFALAVWVHMEGSFPASPLQMPRYFTGQLMVELGLGVGLVGFSAFCRHAAEPVVGVMRAIGVLLLFYSLYAMGFYRHFSRVTTSGSIVLPVAMLGFGAVGLALGAARFDTASVWLRRRLVVLLAVVLGVGAACLLADVGVLPRGRDLQFFNFGWYRHYDLAEWILSLAAWVVWFCLAGWCVAFGTKTGRKDYVNIGVLAVGLGVMTRFFDLIGSMAETGTLFVVGGLVLLVTGWATEKWRRRLIVHIEVTR